MGFKNLRSKQFQVQCVSGLGFADWRLGEFKDWFFEILCFGKNASKVAKVLKL